MAKSGTKSCFGSKPKGCFKWLLVFFVQGESIMSFDNPRPFFLGMPASGAVKALEVSQGMDLEQEYQDSVLRYRRGERNSNQRDMRRVGERHKAHLVARNFFDKHPSQVRFD